MTMVEADIRGLVEVVCNVPEVPQRQRDEVTYLADEVLRECACTKGQDLNAFLTASQRLQRACERPDTPARDCAVDSSDWFEEVGIRDRERRDEERESRHFSAVREVSSAIEACCNAIREVVSTAETAVRCLIGPAKRIFEIIAKLGLTQLVQPAVEVVIEALRGAKATATDRNCVIASCLDKIAECAGAAAKDRPEPPVELAKHVRQTASTGNVAVEIAARIAADISVKAQIEACPEEPKPEPAPEPEQKPEPKPEPKPAPTPTTPTGEGVIPPPPELAEVKEPPPPPKKVEMLTQPASANSPAPGSGQGTDPWAMKKMGEWS